MKAQVLTILALFAIAFGAIWMGYEQHVANHIAFGIQQAASQGAFR